MKSLLIALTLSATTLVALPSVSVAASDTNQPSHEVIAMLNHASFMPNLMKGIMQHDKKWGLSEQQVIALRSYYKHHSPKVTKMAMAIVKLEEKAAQMTLDNYPPEVILAAASASLQIRHNLIVAQLTCRSFVKSVLTPQQYKDVLTSSK